MTINTNRMIELALVFFVSLLSFSIGTYVGKKYSDNQHRLAQLEPKNENTDLARSNVIDHDSQTTDPSMAPVEKQTAMTDADVAKLSEEFATEDEVASNNQKNDPNTKTISEVTDQTISPTVGSVAKKEKTTLKTTTQKVVTTPNLAREVASIAEKAKTMGGAAFYTVQVGAYPTTVDAEKMTESLKSSGYKASSVAAVVNGKTWYRVQVGLFDNLQSAQDYKKDLIEKNKLTSAIIQKIQK